MTRLTIRPDPTRGPGYAILRIAGAAKAISDPSFRIMHAEGEKPNLGPAGWQAEAAELKPLSATAKGADLILGLGPAVVNRVLPGVVQFALPAAGISAEPLDWTSNIQTLAEGWEPSSVDPDLRGATPDEKSAARKAPPDPSSQGPGPPVRPSRRRSLGWALGGALLLLLLAGLGFGARHYLLTASHRPESRRAHTPPVSPSKPTKAAKSAICGGTVAEVISCAKSPDALFAIGTERWASDPNGAFLVLQSAADRGSAKAAYFLARRLDPVGFQAGGPIPKPEPREAAHDYRIAVKSGIPGAVERRAALKAWLEQRAKAGDPMAPLALHDFWSKP